ncbi:MAG: patatin-like phospholipase family protein [Candidatus Omnitrophota bacterium]
MNSLFQMIDKISLIKQIPIFHKLNWLELHMIAGKSQFVGYQKGELIYREGDPPDALYCVISGRLRAYTVSEDAKEVVVEYIYRGMHFGIISLLTKEKHSLTMQAVNDSIIVKIPQGDFETILKQIPSLGIAFSYSLSRRLKRRELHAKSIFESTIISIYSSYKNAGSSTYALYLALGLKRETNKKVILVNINSHQKKTISTAEKMHTVSPFWKKEAKPLKDIVNDHQKILDNITTMSSNADLLSVIFDPNDSSLVDKISEFVCLLANDYHFVVVDLPNDMDEIVLKTLTQSDIVHLLTTEEEKSLSSVREVIERLKMVFKTQFVKEKIQVLASQTRPAIHLTFEKINQKIGYDVFAVLPFVSSEELNEEVDSQDLCFYELPSESLYRKQVTKIARQIGGVLVGLVLGSGGALGIAHIGALRILEREKIPIDIIVGSSIGALIGGLWVSGQSVDQIEKAAREFSTKLGCFKLLDFVLSKAGLIGGHGIKRWLRGKIGDRTFYDVKIPFKVTAYDLNRREELVIEEGRLIDAIQKSVAIPGIVKPVTKQDQLIIDGGILNPLPVNVLIALGIKKIIAINVFQSPAEVVEGNQMVRNWHQKEESILLKNNPGFYLRIRLHRFFSQLFSPNISNIIIRSFQASEYILAEQSSKQVDVLIHPHLAGIDWFELYKVDQLIQRGEEAVINKLEDIKKLVYE